MKYILWLLGFVLILPFGSCTKDGDTIYVNEDTIADTRPMVFFVYRKGNIGDITYTDAMYRGVVQAAEKCNLLVSLAEMPVDTSEADGAMRYFLQNMQTTNKKRRALIVITNDGMESLLHKYDSMLRRSSNVDMLLLESRDTTLSIHTMYLPLYGACYQAGRVVGEAMGDVNNVMVANANRFNSTLGDMRDGFTAGVRDAGRELTVNSCYFSNSDGGYDQADSAYQYSYEIDSIYQMVLPLCGGTIQGFLRYNREHSQSFYTIGLDADMQNYSTRTPFSLVKHLDKAVSDWTERWAAGETLPHHVSYGLASGFTELVAADAYSGRVSAVAQRVKAAAIEKEKEYESNK